MSDRYCFQAGRLQTPPETEPTGLQPTARFHLAADGALRAVADLPPLKAGEGALQYAGDFYVEPLEIQIEFLKADTAQKWLESLLLRHMDRLRRVEAHLWVLAEIEEVNP